MRHRGELLKPCQTTTWARLSRNWSVCRFEYVWRNGSARCITGRGADVGVHLVQFIAGRVSHNVTFGAETRTATGNNAADAPRMSNGAWRWLVAASLFAGLPAVGRTQAAAHVDVSVTVLPAPAYVATESRPTGLELGLRVVGAATCAAVAFVGDVAEPLGACHGTAGVGSSTWARLHRSAAARPVRLLLTIDAGT